MTADTFVFVDLLDSQLRRRAIRSLAIQIAGGVMFVVCAVLLAAHGHLLGAVILALVALMPLGLAVFWARVIRRGPAAVRQMFTGSR